MLCHGSLFFELWLSNIQSKWEKMKKKLQRPSLGQKEALAAPKEEEKATNKVEEEQVEGNSSLILPPQNPQPIS